MITTTYGHLDTSEPTIKTRKARTARRTNSDKDEDRGSRRRCVLSPWYVFFFRFLIFTNYLQVVYTNTNTTTGMTNAHHHHTLMNDTPNDRQPAQPNNEGCDNNNEWGDEQWQWGGGSRRVVSWGPGMIFCNSFFYFSNNYLQYNVYDCYYVGWQNYIRPKQRQMLFCTQVFLFFVFIHVFSQLSNIFIFSSERRSTKADASQQKYMKAPESQRRPVRTNSSQHRPTKASIGQWGPTKLDESQCRPMKVNTGQQEFMKVSEGRLEWSWWTLCKTFFTFLWYLLMFY